MAETDLTDEVVPTSAAALPAALMRPSAFPGGEGPVTVCETHASWVFLCGDRAYKVKKPVLFPFLDYATVERRAAMCDEEVRVNRRLAPSIYLGVRPVVRDNERLRVGEPGEGPVVDHAVLMRRFSSGDTLAAAIRSGAGASAVELTARRLAAFHAAAPVAPVGEVAAQRVRAVLDETFATLATLARDIGARELSAAERFARTFLAWKADELSERGTAGRVRDGHGDLRAEHVLVKPGGGIEIVDAIEFDPALRRIDVAEDLAFLVMDLAALGAPALGRRLVDAYRDAGGDPGDDRLVAFFAALKAWIRAKVLALRATQLVGRRRAAVLGEAAALAALGERFAWRARDAQLIAVCGTAATGKSTVARELHRVTGLSVVASDAVRKGAAGLALDERGGTELYGDARSRETYRELGRRASAARAAAGGAIVDATFRRPEDRAAFAAAVGEAVDLWVECRAPAVIVRERARRRAADPTRVSDAGPEEAERQLASFAPLDEITPETHAPMRTDRPESRLVRELAALLDARLLESPGRLRAGEPARSAS
jgi:aminoglycoside phosphotransferase family enzyme/predicted kinase